MSVYIIETTRLRLVPFTEKFMIPRYIKWLNDSEVMRFSDQRFVTHTEESCRNYLTSFKGTPNCFWAITCIDETVGFMGSTTAYIDRNNLVADVGILIGEKQHWGKGYGVETFSGVIDWLFRMENMRRVSAGTMATHKAMIKTMVRSGMRKECRRKSYYLVNGEEIDSVQCAVFREEWIKSFKQEERHLGEP